MGGDQLKVFKVAYHLTLVPKDTWLQQEMPQQERWNSTFYMMRMSAEGDEQQQRL